MHTVLGELLCSRIFVVFPLIIVRCSLQLLARAIKCTQGLQLVKALCEIHLREMSAGILPVF
jgi:hypothetical protein